MKSVEAFHLLKNAIPRLNMNLTQSGTNYQLKGAFDLGQALREVKDIPGLEKEAQEALQFQFFSDGSDTVGLSKDTYDRIKVLITMLQAKATAIFDFHFEPSEQKEDAIDIRLPDVHTFSEMEKVISDFKICLEVSLNEAGIEHDLKIVSARPGSIWFVATAGSKFAVHLIGTIAKKAIEFRKELTNTRLMEQYLSRMKMEDKQRQVFIDQALELNKTVSEKLAREIIEEVPGAKEEAQKHLATAVQIMAKLFNQGGKVLPESQNVEIVTSFPSIDQYNSSNNIQGKIEDKKE